MVFWVQDNGFEFVRQVDSYCIVKHNARVDFSSSHVHSGIFLFVFQAAPIII